MSPDPLIILPGIALAGWLLLWLYAGGQPGPGDCVRPSGNDA